MSEMRVRQATVDDMDQVIALALRFVHEMPFGGALDGVSPATLAPVFNLVLERGACFVTERIERAADDGYTQELRRLVGFLAVVALVHPLTGKLYADEIAWWMEPEYRSGLGGIKMLRCAEEWARQNGLSCLKMVAPANTTVGTFYERQGYTAIETAYLKHFAGAGERDADRPADERPA